MREDRLFLSSWMTITSLSHAISQTHVACRRSGSGYYYRASKSALNIITKSLSIDLASQGITATLLHPGEEH
jgi:NAD(P)-dependent dehydrogenase (short-subunit alcohol dehydrogenase family)